MKIVNVLILFDLYRESINFVQKRWIATTRQSYRLRYACNSIIRHEGGIIESINVTDKRHQSETRFERETLIFRQCYRCESSVYQVIGESCSCCR